MIIQLTKSENFVLAIANNLMNLSKRIQKLDRKKSWPDFEHEVKQEYLGNLASLLQVINEIYKEQK